MGLCGTMGGNMRRRSVIFPVIAFLATILLTLAPAHSSAQTAAAKKNLKTDFGAKGDGATDDSRAFKAFNAWALDWQQTHAGLIELDMPAGTFLYGGAYDPWPFKGIKKLLVVGYGATLKVRFTTSTAAPSPYGIFLGGRGIIQSTGHSARVESVAAGSNRVTLLNRAQVSLFAVGKYALMAGIDMMGYGFPINPYYFQFVKVTTVDAATGSITFAAPLTDSYKKTWPHYNSGNRYEVDQGGPATLYELDPSWDTEFEYRGLTFATPAKQIYASGRRITYTDITFLDGCPIPTQNEVWTANNLTIPASSSCSTIEADKLVDKLIFNGGTFRSIIFQSASINTFETNATNVTGYIVGTPKKAIINNSIVAGLGMGTPYFGATSEVVCSNSTIRSILNVYGIRETIVGQGHADTMAEGVISIPNTRLPVRWAVPGAKMFWATSSGEVAGFTVTDLSQDANNTYIHTSLSGGFPPVPRGTDESLAVRGDPVPKLTFTNCTGSAEADDLSRAPAGEPIYSYTKRTYSGAIGTGVNLTAQQPYIPIWGTLVSIKINVVKADTGAHNALLLSTPMLAVRGASGINYTPEINLMAAGERVITPTGITGALPGDVLQKTPGDVWMTLTRAYLNNDISADAPDTFPVVTVEIVAKR
jgi:uncharacterized membrane protein